MRSQDVAVIGGGQAALALGFYLRRTGLSHVILDDQREAGGAWRHGWKSLRAFSPAQWSSLPGWLMPRGVSTDSEYPSREEVVNYLTEYERRYSLPVMHGVRVLSVERSIDDQSKLVVRTDGDNLAARAVISATGGKPYIPEVPGRAEFRGTQIHSFDYSSSEEFRGKNVVVAGGGNSGAQIVAELTENDSGVAKVTWATLHPPRFLPDEIDGRYLFDQATAQFKAQQEGRTPERPPSLGDIVMVAPVKAARDRGDLTADPMFERLTPDGAQWPDGSITHEDAIIWATGFRPALDHLEGLGIIDSNGRAQVDGASGTRSVLVPNLWLVGYGNWTGYASATLIGVGRSARATVREIEEALTSPG